MTSYPGSGVQIIVDGLLQAYVGCKNTADIRQEIIREATRRIRALSDMIFWVEVSQFEGDLSKLVIDIQTPRFKHDCVYCRFLGFWEWKDLYVHDDGEDGEMVVVRAGDGVNDTAITHLCSTCPASAEAVEAVRRLVRAP